MPRTTSNEPPRRDQLKRGARRLQQYVSVVGWIVRDGILRFRHRFAVIFIANLAGMGLQLAAFGAIFAAAQALERNATLEMAGMTLTPRESPAVLALMAVFVAVLLAVSAASIFFSRTRGIRLRRRYEEFCSKRALLLASRLPLPTADSANRILAVNGVSVIAHKHTRICGRVLWLMVNATVPTGRAIIALAVMFAINWAWTAVVIGLMPIAAYLLYGVNVSAARTSWRTVRLAAVASRAKRRMIEQLQLSATPLDERNESTDDWYPPGDGVKHADAFFERFLIRERAQLISNLFTAGAFLAVLLVAGAGVFQGHMSWTALAAYLVALRFFLTSTKGIVNVFVQVSRFYPAMRSYFDFVQDARRVERTVIPERTSRRIELDLPSLEGGPRGPILNPGERAWLFVSERVDRALAARLQLHTVSSESDLPGSYWFATTTEELSRAHTQMHSAILTRAQSIMGQSATRFDPLIRLLSERVVILATDVLPESSAPGDPVVILNKDSDEGHGWCTVAWLKDHQEIVDRVMSRSSAHRYSMPDDEDEDDEQ